MAGKRRAAKDCAGEIQDVAHRERVVLQIGAGEDLADIRHKGQVPRGPEPADEDGGKEQAHGRH